MSDNNEDEKIVARTALARAYVAARQADTAFKGMAMEDHLSAAGWTLTRTAAAPKVERKVVGSFADDLGAVCVICDDGNVFAWSGAVWRFHSRIPLAEEGGV